MENARLALHHMSSTLTTRHVSAQLEPLTPVPIASRSLSALPASTTMVSTTPVLHVEQTVTPAKTSLEPAQPVTRLIQFWTSQPLQRVASTHAPLMLVKLEALPFA